MAEEHSHEVVLTDQNFKEEVEQYSGVVLADFWAEWCPPCRALAPIVERLAEQYASNPNVKIGKIDTEANPELTERFNIRSIPALKFFQNGELVFAVEGLQPQQKLAMAIDKLLENAPEPAKAGVA